MLAVVAATDLKTGRAICSFLQHRLCRNHSAASGLMANGGTADSYTCGNGNAKQHFPTPRADRLLNFMASIEMPAFSRVGA